MLAQALEFQTQKRSALVTDNGYGLISHLFGGTKTKNGTVVSNTSALTLSAFYNAITIICNDYAKLPKHVIQKTSEGTFKYSKHPVEYLINKRPNEYMNAFGFDALLIKCALLKGNGYAEIIRNDFAGVPQSLEYIDESKTPVTIFKSEGKLFYEFGGKVIEGSNMLHFRSLFSDNGITGIGIVKFAARSLGVSLSSQEFAEEYYNSKGIGLGVVTSAKDIDTDGKTRLAAGISADLTAKSSGKFGVTVLDQMGSFQHIKITPQEAMFLETNQMAIGEVARWLNIPVYKLKDTQNQNNSNMEHQSIQHVSDSILPWSMINEQEYSFKLFTQTERENGLRVKFNTNSLLLSDKKTQAEYYKTMVHLKSMTPNEVRDLEDMNPIEGGDVPFYPLNMGTDADKKQQNTKNNE